MPEYIGTVTTVEGILGVVLDGSESGLNHATLINRSSANQHPISAITGLQDALDAKGNDLVISNGRMYLADSEGSPLGTGIASPSGSSAVVLGSLSLPAVSWSGNASPYSQGVNITGITANSKIDLQPDATVLNRMITDGTTALWVENNDGIATIYALGAKPTATINVQYTRTEVAE